MGRSGTSGLWIFGRPQSLGHLLSRLEFVHLVLRNVLLLLQILQFFGQLPPVALVGSFGTQGPQAGSRLSFCNLPGPILQWHSPFLLLGLQDLVSPVGFSLLFAPVWSYLGLAA